MHFKKCFALKKQRRISNLLQSLVTSFTFIIIIPDHFLWPLSIKISVLLLPLLASIFCLHTSLVLANFYIDIYVYDLNKSACWPRFSLDVFSIWKQYLDFPLMNWPMSPSVYDMQQPVLKFTYCCLVRNSN